MAYSKGGLDKHKRRHTRHASARNGPERRPLRPPYWSIEINIEVYVKTWNYCKNKNTSNILLIINDYRFMIKTNKKYSKYAGNRKHDKRLLI